MSLAALAMAIGGIISLNAPPSKAVVTGAAAIKWSSDLTKALSAAKKSKKLILLDFGADWCGPCKKMLATTYKDAAVVQKSKDFIPVLIDIDKQPKVAEKYKIEAVPTIIFLDSKGTIVARKLGYTSVPEFLKFMAEAKSKATK